MNKNRFDERLEDFYKLFLNKFVKIHVEVSKGNTYRYRGTVQQVINQNLLFHDYKEGLIVFRLDKIVSLQDLGGIQR